MKLTLFQGIDIVVDNAKICNGRRGNMAIAMQYNIEDQVEEQESLKWLNAVVGYVVYILLCTLLVCTVCTALPCEVEIGQG